MIDSVWIPVLIFVLFVSVLVAVEILVSFSESASETMPFFENYAAIRQGIGYVMFGIYFGIPLVGVILAYLSGGSEPILLIASLIFLFVGVFIFGVLRAVNLEIIEALPNVYEFVTSNTTLNAMVDYYPLVMFIFGLLTMMAQMVKGYGEK